MNSRGTKLTYAGLTALARANTGERLLFTRVVMGDGDLEEGQNIRELTDLVHPVLELPILENRITGVGTSIIETELKNMQLQRGFMAKELGVYATIGEDAEFLYSVRNTGTDSEYIPAGGGPEVVDVVYEVVTVVDQAENVYANISGVGSTVAKKDFQAHIENINPHKNFLQIGKQVESCQNIFVSQGNCSNRRQYHSRIRSTCKYPYFCWKDNLSSYSHDFTARYRGATKVAYETQNEN